LLVKQTHYSAAELTVEPDKVTQDTKTREIAMQM